ncbi:MAG: XdhC family protein [Sphingobacteriales bacterium]|jgi:xanthine/CO dehydrogenase XdhC/CoxF family maturation factor
MKELKEIVKAYDAAVLAGKKVALASVVYLDGSSYRRPGARMLVSDEGELTGAISGGCLEGDALRKALLAISQGRNRLITYDTNDEDDMTIGVQLGCAGVIQVLFEPLAADNGVHPVALLRKALAFRQASVLVTLFDLDHRTGDQPGTCLLVESNGQVTGGLGIIELNEVVMEDAALAFERKQSIFREYRMANGAVYNAFVEYLHPPVSLVIIGAGNDAVPMMQIADSLGWEVRVVDGRNTHARPERFQAACQVLVSRPESVLDQLSLDSRTVFVMMTHNYNYDLAMLKALLPSAVAYIGMLGPRKKLDRMLDELKHEGVALDADQLNKVYGPAGLEIGAETPEEIALSMIAEIQAVLAGKSGGMLRGKSEVIHDRERTRISVRNV